MNLPNDAIRDIAVNVWSTMFSADLCPVDVPESALERGAITSYVLISGGWDGAVTVLCEAELARELAARLFEMAPADVSRDEIRDALGEIANVCGGNIKALFPEPSYLSLPTVLDEDESHLAVVRGRVIRRVGFTYEGKAIVVALIESDKKATPRA